MRKSIVFMLIATLILGALMVSCNSDVSEGTNVGDKLVEVTISGGSTSKGISAVGSMENADAYFWYYKAGKNDSSVYRTGETVAVSNGVLGAGGWKPVKTNDNNEAVVGLKNSNLGYFSTGDWLFSFVAYKKVATFDGDAATNGEETLTPVYYQYNLAVEVSTSTIATDEKVYITVTPNVGDAQGDAEFVFPEAGLTWKYVNDTSADAQYTLAALDGKKAYMYVYYKDNSVTDDTEHLLARSAEATITSGSTEANGTFTGFKGIDGTSEYTIDPVTIASTYSGKNYTLYFRVVLKDNNEEIGSTNTQSVTAYTGGKITISSTGTASVYDNEVQYQVVISDIDAVAVSPTKSTATVDSPAVPNAPSEPESVGESNKTESTQASAQKTITSSITAVEETAEKKTTVIIPEAGLAATTVTKTLTEKTDDNNKTVTTVTESSSHTLDMEVKTDVTPTTSTAISITAGQAKVAGVDLTLTKTTTTVTETATTVGGNTTSTTDTETSAPVAVPTFNNLYVTVSTYITKGLSGVNVVYDGEEQDGYELVFNANSDSPSVATASENSGNSNDGTGYNPTTGLLVFKTNHFSSYIVTCAPVVKLIHETTETGYATLEDALKASDHDDTITFVSNVTISADKTATSDRLVVSKSITINFGEYTLTAPGSLEPTDNWSALFITGNVVFEGTTGGILCQDNSNAAGPYAVTVRDNGTLTVNGGVYHGGGTAFQVVTGNLTINDGTISATAFGSPYLMDFVLNCIDANYDNTANIVVKGGKYQAFNPGDCKAEGANTNYVADGYQAVANKPAEGWWTVEGMPDVIISKTGETDQPMSLAEFRNNVNSGTTYDGYTVTLQRDVNLNGSETNQWTPIGQYKPIVDGDSKTSFGGVFDGNNFTISGLYIDNYNSGKEYQALFGHVDNGTVKNLTVIGSVKTRKSAAGVVAKASRNTLIENVTSNVIVESNDKAGGIVCAAFPNHNTTDLTDQFYTVTIKDCTNKGSVTCSGQATDSTDKIAGAIVGNASNFGKVIIQNCNNTGSVTSQYVDLENVVSGGATRVGFVLGQSSNQVKKPSGNSDNPTGIDIIGCTNTGLLKTIPKNGSGDEGYDIVVGYTAGASTSGYIVRIKCNSKDDFTDVSTAKIIRISNNNII